MKRPILFLVTALLLSAAASAQDSMRNSRDTLNRRANWDTTRRSSWDNSNSSMRRFDSSRLNNGNFRQWDSSRNNSRRLDSSSNRNYRSDSMRSGQMMNNYESWDSSRRERGSYRSNRDSSGVWKGNGGGWDSTQRRPKMGAGNSDTTRSRTMENRNRKLQPKAKTDSAGSRVNKGTRQKANKSIADTVVKEKAVM